MPRRSAQVAARWRDRAGWWRSSVLNTARVGWFSSDRAIREYAEGDLERGGDSDGRLPPRGKRSPRRPLAPGVA